MADPRYSIFAARAVFDPRLTATDVRVLAALGTYSNKQGWCNPKQATIAIRVGVSRTTVTASMKRLVETGYLEVKHQVVAGRGQTANNYRVILDLDPMSAWTTPGADVDQDDTPMSAQPTGGVVPVGHPPTNQDDTQKEHSQLNDSSRVVAPVRDDAWKSLWSGRLAEAQARAGDTLNLTSADAHTFAALVALVEPTLGTACDWDLDVLPGIDKLAASFRSRSKQFYSWKLVREHAIENRDLRLAGLPAPQAQPIKTNGHAPSRGRTDSAAVIARVAAEMGVK